MQNFLLEMSKSHAPEMGMVYHEETVLIAQNLLKRFSFYINDRVVNSHWDFAFKEKSV